MTGRSFFCNAYRAILNSPRTAAACASPGNNLSGTGGPFHCRGRINRFGRIFARMPRAITRDQSDLQSVRDLKTFVAFEAAVLSAKKVAVNVNDEDKPRSHGILLKYVEYLTK